MNHPLSWIFLLVVLVGCSLSASGQEQPNLPVAMRQLTLEMMATGSSTDSRAADYGHILLDAFHATGDTYYYTCARKMGRKPVGRADALLMLRLYAESGDTLYRAAARKAMRGSTESPLMVKRNMAYLRRDSALPRPYVYLGMVLPDSAPRYLRLMSLALNQHKRDSRTRSGLYPDDFTARIAAKATALYTLTNGNGLEACVTNYGARLVSLMVPDRQGELRDVVLGFQNIDDYYLNRQNFGATVGRYASRIARCCFSLDGVEYHTQDTGGGNTAHGGYPGFADRVWTVVDVKPQSVKMKYESPDGENGFPGALTITLTYTLTDDNALRLDYSAATTKTTVLNITHHSFFNLSGNLTETTAGQWLQVVADSMAEYGPDKNVTGRMLHVAGTPFDFRQMRCIGDSLHSTDAQLKVTKGYDHSWVLRQPGSLEVAAAQLWDPVSGRLMKVYTTEPAAHVYMANGLKGVMSGKFAQAYPSRSALCVETMHFADSPNQPQFPTTTLRPGQTYRSTTIYKFDVK